MAINYVAGQMLNATLERAGNNLAFSDTANSTPVLYIDIANSRVGINTDTPSVGLDVNGNILANNLLATFTVSATGNVVGGNITTVGLVTATGNVVGGNITTLGTVNGNNITATSNIAGNTITAGNIVVFDTTITTNLANGNIILTATGTELVQVSGTSGLVIPSGNTAQRPSPEITGTIRVNTSLGQIEAWDGTEWVAGSGGGGNVTISDQQITPDGSSLVYTLDADTNQASILVSFNGVGQLPGTAYTVTGNSITFAQAPLETDIVDIRFLASTTYADRLVNSTGNTRVQVYDNSNIVLNSNNSNVVTINSTGIFNISLAHSIQLPVYTVSTASALGNVTDGQVIYVSDGDTGNPCLAVYSGTAFKRISLGANIST